MSTSSPTTTAEELIAESSTINDAKAIFLKSIEGLSSEHRLTQKSMAKALRRKEEGVNNNNNNINHNTINNSCSNSSSNINNNNNNISTMFRQRAQLLLKTTDCCGQSYPLSLSASSSTTSTSDSNLSNDNDDVIQQTAASMTTEERQTKIMKMTPKDDKYQQQLSVKRKRERDRRTRKKVMVEDLQRSVTFFSRANGTIKHQNDELTRLLMQAQAQVSVIESIKTVDQRCLNGKRGDDNDDGDALATSTDVGMKQEIERLSRDSFMKAIERLPSEEEEAAKEALEYELYQPNGFSWLSNPFSQSHTQQQHHATLDVIMTEPELARKNTSLSNRASNLTTTTSNSGSNTGRWTSEEHTLFLQGVELHGKCSDMIVSRKIADTIKSRTSLQVLTHAQAYFRKLARTTERNARQEEKKRKTAEETAKAVERMELGNRTKLNKDGKTLFTGDHPYLDRNNALRNEICSNGVESNASSSGAINDSKSSLLMSHPPLHPPLHPPPHPPLHPPSANETTTTSINANINDDGAAGAAGAASSTTTGTTFGSGASAFGNEDDDAPPKKKRTRWTKEQDVAVLLKRTTLRKSWRTISLEIPGRSEMACMKRHILLVKEHSADSKNALAAKTRDDNKLAVASAAKKIRVHMKAWTERKRAEKEKIRVDKKAETERKRAEDEKIRVDKKAETERKRAEDEKIWDDKKAETERKRAEKNKKVRLWSSSSSSSWMYIIVNVCIIF
jgi:SHAQKYF class myb-like DNA-binding protein